MSVNIKNLEPHNITVAAGVTASVYLVNQTIQTQGSFNPVNKPVKADGFYITAIGTDGDSIGVRVDADPVAAAPPAPADEEFFEVITNETILFRIPVNKKLVLKNSGSSSIDVSIGFIRGKNKI